MNAPALGLREPSSPRYPSSPPPRWTPGPPGPPVPAPADVQVPMPVLAGFATFCTALCLGNLFDGLRWWLLPATGAIVVAGLCGELGRRLHFAALVMPLVYLAAGWLYVIPVAAHASIVGPGVSLRPSGATFSALRALADSGSRDIHTLSVPVPERPGFLFLTVAGVYLIAALVDGIAVGLHRPAAAGLPLLALVAVPSAVVERGVGLMAFAASCAAYVALLLASGRRELSRWARLPPGAATGIRRMTGATGRQVAVVSIVAALVVPVAIPRFAGIARHHHGGAGSGSATVIEPVVTLAQQLHSQVTQPLLTVRTAAPEYLRLTALEHFDGRSFRLGSLSASSNERISHGLPKVVAGPAERVQDTIDVLPVLHQRYLPVPYQATEVSIAGDWRLASRNFTIFSAQTDTSGAHYTVTSEVANPSPAELRAQSAGLAVPADVSSSTELPTDLPVEVIQLSAQLSSGLTTEYDRAAAIQAYLRGPRFTYDLNGAPTGPNALVDFLLHRRRGYCEQFAGAMVVLARVAGIPARVAIGFTPGTRRADGSWLVTNRDAHSWPELWFPQAGWVRFEPTKRDESTTPPAYTFAPAGSAPGATAAPSASAAPSAQPSARASAGAANKPAAPTAGAAAGGGGGGFAAGALGWGAAVLAALALVLSPAALRRGGRRRRLGHARGRGGPAPGGEPALWREVVDTAVDLGLELAPTLTPRRAVQYWSRRSTGERCMPDTTYAVLMEVAYAEELARYAAEGSRPAEIATQLAAALGAWERSFGRRVRLRALLAPRSMLADIAATGSRLAGLRRRPGPVDQT
jgi:transglutaminase-like putative cysteine protease